MPSTQRRPQPIRHAGQTSSVDPAEVEKFSALAQDWWNPEGSLAPLHRLNPIRLGFIRGRACAHFARDAAAMRPFDGLSLVDIGCGGGLLSEPAARLGFEVTAIDASPENIAAAARHAGDGGLAIDFRSTTAEDLVTDGTQFDVVLAMEIIEHVPAPEDFLSSCTRLLRPGGLLFLATINKTLRSLALAKFGAEYVLGWVAPGTHDWNKFLPPARLTSVLEKCGLTVDAIEGVVFDPVSWDWRTARDTSVNYMLSASR